MNDDSHPLDWYPEPDDDPKGVPMEAVESWVSAYLDYEDSRLAPTLVAVLVPPARPSVAAIERSRRLWDQRVYFMRCLDCRLIKIGFSRNVEKRRAQLERSSEHILDILGTMGGDRWIESQAHSTFIRDRVKGEWFRASDELLAYIKEHTVRPDEMAPLARGGRR